MKRDASLPFAVLIVVAAASGVAKAQVAPACVPFNNPGTKTAVQNAIFHELETQATPLNGKFYSIINVTPAPVSGPDINGQMTTTQSRPLPLVTNGLFVFGIYSFTVQLDPYANAVCDGSATVIIDGYAIYNSSGQQIDGMNMPFGGRWLWNFTMHQGSVSLTPTDWNGNPIQQPNGPAGLINQFYNIPISNINVRPASAESVSTILPQ